MRCFAFGGSDPSQPLVLSDIFYLLGMPFECHQTFRASKQSDVLWL